MCLFGTAASPTGSFVAAADYEVVEIATADIVII